MSVIATVTPNPTIDTSTSAGTVSPERKLRCDRPRHDPGGGGINVSRAIRKLGGDSVALYLNGGPTGGMLSRLLDTEEVEHRPVAMAGWTRENFIVVEKSSGQQYRFGMPGPDIVEPEWSGLLDAVRRLDPAPGYIVGSGSLPPGAPLDFYARLARIASERGSRAVIDTSGEPLRLAVAEGVHLVKPNLNELRFLAGAPLEDEMEQEEAARELIGGCKCSIVVVSLGAAGALLVTDGRVSRLRAPTVPIKSKVGAGDSMVAGIVLSLARGLSVEEAAMFGLASGAAAVMRPGTQLCRRDDAERLYARLREGRE